MVCSAQLVVRGMPVDGSQPFRLLLSSVIRRKPIAPDSAKRPTLRNASGALNDGIDGSDGGIGRLARSGCSRRKIDPVPRGARANKNPSVHDGFRSIFIKKKNGGAGRIKSDNPKAIVFAVG